MNRWYILRSSDNKAQDAGIRMFDLGMRTFCPTEYRATTIGKDKIWEQFPSRPDLLFVNGTYDDIRSLITLHDMKSLEFLCTPSAGSITTPVTVNDYDMENLMRLVNVGMPQSYSVTEKEIHYRPGGPVRVTEGPFKDIVGRVARIHTQTRVVVSIPGVISYATAYIPKHQMEQVI